MLGDLFYRLQAILRRNSMETELDEELRAHVELQAEKYVRAGMSPEDAARRAKLEFGGIEQVKEECRDSWGVRLVSELAQDIRYGFRQLRRNPGFTVVAVLTLALGIGANTAMFSFVDAVIIRPLPYPHPDELVEIHQWRNQAQSGLVQSSLSALNVLDLQDENQSFQDIGFYHWEHYILGGTDSPEQLLSAATSWNLLKVLGVEPILGRGFTSSEAKAGHNDVALISYQIWHDQFGGKRDALDTTVDLDGKPYTIIGILPKDFYFIWDNHLDFITPLALNANDLAESQRSRRDLNVLGRLKSSVSIEQAQAEVDTIAARLAARYPDANKGWGLKLDGLHSTYYRHVRKPLVAIIAAAFLVLLIACVNVANLLLARSATRQREIALRAALGAARKRIFGQLLTESILLGLAGGLMGVLCSWAGVRLLIYLCSRYSPTPGTQWIALNGTALAFCLVLSGICGLVFGIVPSLYASNRNVNESLKEGAAAVTTQAGGRRTLNAFAICEVALATLLIVGAGLMVRTFTNLLSTNLGYDPQHLLDFGIQLPTSRYKTGAQQAEFFNAVLRRFQALPGVEGACGRIPGDRLVFRLEGQPPIPAGQAPNADAYAISPGFIHTMRGIMIAGREFTDSDDKTAPPVAIINETLAHLYFPNVNPVGRQIIPLSETYGDNTRIAKLPIEIVGVVKDMRTEGVQDKTARMYLPYTQYLANPWMLFDVRTAGPPMSLVSEVRKAVATVDRGLPVRGFSIFEKDMFKLGVVRFPMIVLGVFGGLALFLSAIGIFGVISFSVRQRIHEIGVRMALGAERRDVLRMVIGQGLKLALIGVAIGTAGALALTRFVSSLLYGVRPTDPLTFIVVSLILIIVALVACYIPARRAAKVDPMVALRYE